MNTAQHKQHGFTLVEMIVVIAIIAILVAVIIPTTAGFIDRARFSDDQQTAAVMTQAIRSAYILGEVEGELEAWQARDIIDSFTNDEVFTYETSSRNAGFFYIPENLNSRVIVLKYDDAARIPQGNLYHDSYQIESRLSNAIGLKSVWANDLSGINSPEQLFGNDRILLTYSGSLVAEIVAGIRYGFSDQAMRVHADPDAFTVLIEKIFRIQLHRDLVFSILDEFSPEKTVYINNGGAFTTANNSSNVQRVVFAPRISHLPAVALDYIDKISALPSSIKHIDESLVDQLDQLRSLSKPNQTLKSTGDVTLLDIDDEIIICTTIWQNNKYIQTETPAISYDFSQLSIRVDVTGYSVDIKGDTISIHIYTREGLTARITKNEIISCNP